MTQTTIYLLVNRGDETLMLDGSLYLFNELFSALNIATKGTSESITTQPATDHAEPVQAGIDNKNSDSQRRKKHE
jgi:hypothetical protein